MMSPDKVTVTEQIKSIASPESCTSYEDVESSFLEGDYSVKTIPAE